MLERWGLVGTWANLVYLVNSRPVTDPDSKNKRQHLRKKLEADLWPPRKHVYVHISVWACTHIYTHTCIILGISWTLAICQTQDWLFYRCKSLNCTKECFTFCCYGRQGLGKWVSYPKHTSESPQHPWALIDGHWMEEKNSSSPELLGLPHASQDSGASRCLCQDSHPWEVWCTEAWRDQCGLRDKHERCTLPDDPWAKGHKGLLFVALFNSEKSESCLSVGE